MPNRLLSVLLWSVAPTVLGAATLFAMQSAKPADQVVYTIDELNKQREQAGRAYLPFLDASTLHCGIYHLPAGGKDNQSPHSQDEVYYVQQGTARFHCDGKDYSVAAGAILFVAAEQKHHFSDIEEDLTLLVFFSKAKPQK